MANNISEQSWANIVARYDGMADRVDSAETAFNTYIADARHEYGHICITPNQAMAPNAGGDGVEGFLHAGLDLTVTVETAVGVGNAATSGWATPASTEFLGAIGVGWNNIAFNILRVAWTKSSGAVIWHFDHRALAGPFTEAAFIKPLTGTIAGGGGFAERQALADGWALWGRQNIADHNAIFGGLRMTSDAGEMLIAMHGAVTGYADLENGKWGMFPALA